MKIESGMGGLLSPKINPQDPIGDATLHLAQGDMLLGAILDVAERGHQEAEEAGHLDDDQRFNTIIDLVKLYRAGIEALDVNLSRFRTVRAA